MKSYGSLCTLFYDLDKPQATDVGLRFYLPFLKAANGPVIELMCGSGRYLEPFLAAGHDVDGLDASPEMLAACRTRISARWPHAALYLQRIDQIDLPRKYVLAVITATSLSLVTDKQAVTDSLKLIFDILQQGGTFVAEVEGYDPHRSGDHNHSIRTVQTGDGGEIILQTDVDYDPATRLESVKSHYALMKNHTLHADEDEELALCFYAEPEFTRMLQDAGFENITRHMGYPDTSAEDMGGVLIFSASKPEA